MSHNRGKIVSNSTWHGIFLPILWLLIFSTPSDAQVQVSVRETSRVTGPWIYVASVASVSAPDALKAQIEGIRICRAPLPGKEKTISGKRIMAKLEGAEVLPRSAKVSVPESIHLAAESQSVPRIRLKRLFETYLADRIKGQRFKISRFRVRGTNRFTPGTLTLSVEKNFNRDLMGTVTLRVRVSVDGQKSGRLALQGWVDRFAQVACASRAVRHHSMITSADIELKTVNLSEHPRDLIADTSSVSGQLSKVALRPGQPIRSCMLAPVPLVKKGDRVAIQAVSGRLRVKTLGVAQTSGGMGEQVRVENIVSGKTVVGHVTGKATVNVRF